MRVWGFSAWQVMGGFKGGKTKRKLNDIVYIDSDDDRFENAIVIDDDEYESKNSFSDLQRHKKVSCVICIDDDDNDDVGCHQTSVGNVGDLDSNASSGRRSFPTSNSKLHMIDIEGDGSPVVDEKKFSYKWSRCKQKGFGKVPARNSYGLSVNTYTASSESDCSDCEVIDSSCEKLQEQWKRDSQKRRTCVPVDDFRADDQASTSSVPCDTKLNATIEMRKEPHLPSPLNSSPNDVDNEEENLSAVSASGDDCASTPLNPKNASYFTESNQTFHQENLSPMEPGFGGKSLANHGMSGRGMFLGDPSPSGDNGVCEKVHCGVTDFNDKECSSERCPLTANIEGVEKLQHDGELLGNDISFLSGKYFCGHAYDQTLTNCASNPLPVNECKAGFLNGGACGEGTVGEDGLSLEKRKVNNVFVFQHGEDISDSMKITLGMEAKGSIDTKNVGAAQIKEVVSCVGSSLINDREKLKASDEYKTAVEEEWASRKRELQIQAEESQRLRKRKKAETLRLLDMQRRQKERLEEVRETQKKDEENMNLKEKIRAEIMESLSKLEVASFDMASLLRGLGIQVGNGLVPQSQEVHAAYKRALLKFHPDRASRMDVRQQVEAEEKFKLISRMKEKLQW